MLTWEQRDGQWFAPVSYCLEADGVLDQQWLAAELLSLWAVSIFQARLGLNRYISDMGDRPVPPEGQGSKLRLQLLQQWLDLEAQCDRELAKRFHQQAQNDKSPAPTPASSTDIDGLLLAAEHAKAAYKASRAIGVDRPTGRTPPRST